MFKEEKRRNIKVYMNHLLAKSKLLEQHIKDIKETFTASKKCNMNLNPLKCTFGVGSCKFLGFLITLEDIKVISDQAKIIPDMPLLRITKKVLQLIRQIIGLNRFISKARECCL